MHERPYEKLVVWQEAYKLCLFIYKVSKAFPADERFGVTNQMRRAAYSVPMNIAEGNEKRSKKEKEHFLEIAHASLEELHCVSRLSCDLKYLHTQDFQKIDDYIQRISYLLIKLRSAIR